MTTLRARLLSATGSLLLIGSLAACGGGSSSDATSAAGGSDGGGETTLTVFAAASLTDAYKEINEDFASEHPNVKVQMTNDGSNNLVSQIAQGAPADVLATADEKNMTKAVDQDLIDGSPTVFATNDLTIAVQPGNPKKITGLKSLSDSKLTVVRCAAEVPCGSVTDALLKDTGVSIKAASEENSVTDVLGKVTSGDADAGLVYVTDVKRSGGKAEQVTIAEASKETTKYPIAVTKDSENKDLAQQYVTYMQSEKAQKVLQDAGFGKA